MASKIFEFSSPSTTWVCNHNLNTYVSSDVSVTSGLNGNEKILPKTVEFTSLNTLTVTFTDPQTGFVAING